MNWILVDKTDYMIQMRSAFGSVKISAEQEFDRTHGTLSTIEIIGSNPEDCEIVLKQMEQTYGAPSGTVRREDAGRKISCIWLFPLCSWNTAYERIYSSTMIRRLSNQYSLSKQGTWALYGVLKSLESLNTLGLSDHHLAELMRAQVYLPEQRESVINCALAIKRGSKNVM